MENLPGEPQNMASWSTEQFVTENCDWHT